MPDMGHSVKQNSQIWLKNLPRFCQIWKISLIQVKLTVRF